MKVSDLVGLKSDCREMTYTWLDVALYAVAVGAGPKDSIYYYEKNMKALPTYGAVPSWSAVHVSPRIPLPFPATFKAQELMHDNGASLQMDHELIMYQPINPIKGTFIYQDEITSVYDRGEGRGAVLKNEMKVYDEAGNHLCTNVSHTLFTNLGGFGGEKMPVFAVDIPDREPDCQSESYVGPMQNVLYRLTGDTNLVHIDQEFAQSLGHKRVFMQGLCSFGYACRMMIDAVIPGEPERMTRIRAQMRSILYPDTAVKLLAWKVGENEAYFRLTNWDTGEVILDRGVFTWK